MLEKNINVSLSFITEKRTDRRLEKEDDRRRVSRTNARKEFRDNMKIS